MVMTYNPLVSHNISKGNTHQAVAITRDASPAGFPCFPYFPCFPFVLAVPRHLTFSLVVYEVSYSHQAPSGDLQVALFTLLFELHPHVHKPNTDWGVDWWFLISCDKTFFFYVFSISAVQNIRNNDEYGKRKTYTNCGIFSTGKKCIL